MLQIFVYKATEKNKQIKVSGSAEILRDIPKQTTVQELANRLRVIDGDTVYVPTSGLFWLRKGTKQCVKLKTDEDFECALTEYTSKNGTISAISIACFTVERPNTTGKILIC
jgi:hypothetical protein